MSNSFCLDVSVGYREDDQEVLIAFLKKMDPTFAVTAAERGRFDEVKKVRVFTARAEDVQSHITENMRAGDDNEYEIHYSGVDARRWMNFLPDYQNPLGYAKIPIGVHEDVAV
jgi:hypothetical protein